MFQDRRDDMRVVIGAAPIRRSQQQRVGLATIASSFFNSAIGASVSASAIAELFRNEAAPGLGGVGQTAVAPPRHRHAPFDAGFVEQDMTDGGMAALRGDHARQERRAAGRPRAQVAAPKGR
jgi:hypothetical protein